MTDSHENPDFCFKMNGIPILKKYNVRGYNGKKLRDILQNIHAHVQFKVTMFSLCAFEIHPLLGAYDDAIPFHEESCLQEYKTNQVFIMNYVTSQIINSGMIDILRSLPVEELTGGKLIITLSYLDHSEYTGIRDDHALGLYRVAQYFTYEPYTLSDEFVIYDAKKAKRRLIKSSDKEYLGERIVKTYHDILSLDVEQKQLPLVRFMGGPGFVVGCSNLFPMFNESVKDTKLQETNFDISISPSVMVRETRRRISQEDLEGRSICLLVLYGSHVNEKIHKNRGKAYDEIDRFFVHFDPFQKLDLTPSLLKEFLEKLPNEDYCAILKHSTVNIRPRGGGGGIGRGKTRRSLK